MIKENKIELFELELEAIMPEINRIVDLSD
ncbi:hypothetical protein J2Z64_004206 [Oceanobacillus polygoni]|uniref:Uncharacterized protein n=1 Tax=Oceanobacillus polygoni TaxID=1235259 RepID=A0A9X1CDK9_9BACI|nr:hypothetical protein [Oceanobacillus polygoni]